MRGHFSIRRDDEALDKYIQTARLQPLLSNAKWVKLLDALVKNWPAIHACTVKLIWEEASGERRLLFDEDTSYGFNYYAHAMEAIITGSPRLGWAAYKEIEWMDFPRFPKGAAGEQDLGRWQQQLALIGQFKMEESPDNLRLYMYRRP